MENKTKTAAQIKRASVTDRIVEVHTQMLASEPGSPEEAVLADKLTHLIFMGEEK